MNCATNVLFCYKISIIRVKVDSLIQESSVTFNYLDEVMVYFEPTNVDEVAEIIRKSVAKPRCLDPVP